MEQKHLKENQSMTASEIQRRGLVGDIKHHNEGRESLIAGEYFGAQYTYAQTYQMIEEYKRGFIAIDGNNTDSITICAPSTIASVNAFYGVTEANKVINLIGPGFLNIQTEYYTKTLDAKTIFIYDGFLTDDLLDRLHTAGVKNVITTSILDYMPPEVQELAKKRGMVSDARFEDRYIREHGFFPSGIEVLDVDALVSAGRQLKGDHPYVYHENQLTARFLTGATTSQLPKCVKLSVDGFAQMDNVYDSIWFDFQPRERLAVIIPLFYATGAIHGMHMGLIEGLTLVYLPKYDRFSFGKDLLESKSNVALVAPSFAAAIDEAGLPDHSLQHVKYLFVGGEAISPVQMQKFRITAKRLGIQHILNGYGMTETGGMVGISDREYDDIRDVSVTLIPGAECRVVDGQTGIALPNGERGVLHVKTPCATLGYFEEEKNKNLFTEDGWINTGDSAVKYSDNRFRVFGRATDCFKNGDASYAMFDIEERILELDEISEAEVVKFSIGIEEYPAAVVVVKPEYADKLATIVKSIFSLDAPGMEYLLGVKFIAHFKINPVTSKRDYLSLQTETEGYYSVDREGKYYVSSIGGEKEEISETQIRIRP